MPTSDSGLWRDIAHRTAHTYAEHWRWEISLISVPLQEHVLAKPNYQYERRQRDLAKKLKQEEKKLRKTQKGDAPPEGDSAPVADPGEAASSR